MSWVWFLSMLPITFQAVDGFRSNLPKHCEKISIPLCRRVLPYNFTRFPNLLGHQTQVLARRSIEHYSSKFVQHANCSKHTTFFLCSFYLPICIPGIEEGVVKPCQSLCEQIKADCSAMIKRWPRFVRCEELPKFSNGVCVQPESFITPSQPTGKLLLVNDQ